MQERFDAVLREGMDVYDFKGGRVGKVSKIYWPASVSSSANV